MRSSHQELDHCRWEIFQASHPAEGTRWGSQQNNGESNHSSRCTERVSFLSSKYFNSISSHSKFEKKKARALNHNVTTFHTTSSPVSFVPYLLSLWAPLASFLELCLQTPTPGPLHLLPCLKYSSPLTSQRLPSWLAPGLFKC